MLKLTFRIFKGTQLVREESLTQNVIKLGKVPSAHVRVDDETVSRMHAIIEVTRGEVSIIDLGSTRGTFVNGHKVNKAALQSGDTLVLGDTRIEVTIAPALASVAAGVPAMTVIPVPTVVAQLPPPVPMVRTAPQMAPSVVLATAVPSPFHQASEDDVHGAKAVEVAAMLGDSVINVKHCMDPRSGKITMATKVTFAMSALCLLASTVAFASSVNTAAKNKSGLEYWTRTLHRPSYAYRADTVSAGFDAMAFGGAALGIIGVTMGLARMRRERKSPYYRIGTAPGVELPLENAPSPSFPLVAPHGDDFVFNYSAGMEGEMVVDGTSTPLAQLAAQARPSATVAGAIELPIPARAKIRAKAGQTTFLVSAVARPRQQQTPLFAGLESRALKYAAGSLAVHLGIVAFLATVPVEDSGVNLDIAAFEGVTVDVSGITQEEKLEEKKPEETGDGKAGDTTEAAKMKLEEGASGKPTADNADGHIRIKDNNMDPAVARQQAIEEARSAGILGSTQAIRDSISSITGQVDISSGADGANVYGPQFGSEGEGRGNFGFGRRGFGLGGGCTLEPCGISGSGRYGTLPGGRRAGDGYSVGPGGGHGRDHVAQDPGSYIGKPVAVGGLDKEIIKRYMKRAANKIAYCYEKKLIAEPNLGGELNMQFFISPDGTVKNAGGKGFDDEVAGCVAGVISDINFPRPSDGGGVQVNYPFSFHRVGG